MEAIRAFIAIELPEDIHQKLGELEKTIQTRAGESVRKAVRWVPASNMHLTLKFLGEVSGGNLEALASILGNESERHTSFDLTVGSLGAFPNLHRPRVIWVGVKAPAELFALQKAIEAETRHLGYPNEDRPFSPHLTLGRIAQNARPDEVAQVARVIQDLQVGELGTVRVERLHLFRSDLRPSGSIYTSLYNFQLKQA